MIRNYNQVVPANGSISIAGATGNYIRCLFSGDSSLRMMIVREGGQSETVTIEAGLGFGTKVFTSLRLENTGNSDLLVRLVVSNEGAVNDSRFVLTGNVTAQIVNPDKYAETITALVAGTAVQVLAESLVRVNATFCAQTDGLFWYNNTVSDVKGINYSAGSAWEIKNKAALWFYPVDGGINAYVIEDEFNA